MRKNIVRVFFIMGAMALVHIANTLMLARNLPIKEMGLFRIVLTVGEFIFVVSLLGVDASFIRFFSRNAPSRYNWKPYVRKTIGTCGALAVILAVAAGIFYDFNPWLIAAVILAVGLSVTNRILNAFLRARKFFQQAAFLERSSSLLFFICLGILLLSGRLNFGGALASYLCAAAVAVGVIIYFTARKIPSGPKTLPKNIVREGVIFFGILATIIIMLNANQLFIAKMLSYENLAVYTVTFSVMRAFELSVNALYYVFVPSLNNDRPVETGKILIFLLLISTAIGGAYLLAGKPLMHFLFQGKYDQGARLIPFFVGIGVCRIFYVFPASVAGGRASPRVLRRFFYGNCLAAAAGIALNYVFILKSGIAGAAKATFYTWLIAAVLGMVSVREEIFCRCPKQ